MAVESPITTEALGALGDVETAGKYRFKGGGR